MSSNIYKVLNASQYYVLQKKCSGAVYIMSLKKYACVHKFVTEFKFEIINFIPFIGN